MSKTRPHYSPALLERAMRALVRAIENDGMEYPDAEWAISQQFGVPADALRAEYDNVKP